jgi:hypothetical protein
MPMSPSLILRAADQRTIADQNSIYMLCLFTVCLACPIARCPGRHCQQLGLQIRIQQLLYQPSNRKYPPK